MENYLENYSLLIHYWLEKYQTFSQFLRIRQLIFLILNSSADARLLNPNCVDDVCCAPKNLWPILEPGFLLWIRWACGCLLSISQRAGPSAEAMRGDGDGEAMHRNSSLIKGYKWYIMYLYIYIVDIYDGNPEKIKHMSNPTRRSQHLYWLRDKMYCWTEFLFYLFGAYIKLYQTGYKTN